MVFNATFNNISVISLQSILLVEETGVSRENHHQWLAAGQWFSPVSPTNKEDCYDITEILLKLALNTTTLTLHLLLPKNIIFM